ncbi:hypothetical protein LG634_32340 [Streptomyces bambusae]|uniref:hypothetical protein n=1 Tax=Streptomyces bambusae TaxID=1550616 RepID=UPI001CFFB0DC|nr:hypothetical protein [Streptomyces bambusae]MCB5169484.1 hypothetical protein [Streptomyces bambusae]
MPAVPLYMYMAARALAFAVGAGLVLSASLIVSTHAGGDAPDRPLPDTLSAAGAAAGIVTTVLLLIFLVSGVLHLRALRAAGIPVDRSTVAAGHDAELRVPADPQAAFRAARSALKALPDTKIRQEDRAAQKLRAVRRAPAHRGFAQIVTVEVAPAAAGSLVRVSSRAAFRLAVFDMGRARITVAEFGAELLDRTAD